MYPENTEHLYNIFTTLYKWYTNVLCLLGMGQDCVPSRMHKLKEVQLSHDVSEPHDSEGTM